jgi:hypothetical protein
MPGQVRTVKKRLRLITNAEAALRWVRAGSSHLHKVQHTLTNIVEDGHRAAEVIDRIR